MLDHGSLRVLAIIVAFTALAAGLTWYILR
jgi:hypothetical protein